MNCQPSPEVTCGSTYQDACVNITGTWPACFPTTAGPCYRQSDYNTAAGNLLCNLATITFGPSFTLPVTLPTGVTSILSSITLTGLTGCLSPLVLTPVKTTVAAEFQNIYNILCANLPVSLNTPLALGPAPGLNLRCLIDPCGVPISTLGGLLQALINCCCSTEDSELVYESSLSQVAAAPVSTVLENTGFSLTFSKTAVGSYLVTASGAGVFLTNKTTVLVGSARNPLWQILAYPTSTTTIVIETYASGVLADNLLDQTAFKIKVHA